MWETKQLSIMILENRSHFRQNERNASVVVYEKRSEEFIVCYKHTHIAHLTTCFHLAFHAQKKTAHAVLETENLTNKQQ